MPPRYPKTVTADQVLRANGLNGDRLLKLARRIANDAQRQAPAGLGGKYEDLVSFLTLQALEACIRYDETRARPGYTFSSYLCDIMERRVPDWYRRKSEGFGDSRSGSNGRIILAGDTLDDEPDTDVDWSRIMEEPPETAEAKAHHHYAVAAGALATPLHDWGIINERVSLQWVRAAEAIGQPFPAWVRRTLDIAAHHQLKTDKQAA